MTSFERLREEPGGVFYDGFVARVLGSGEELSYWLVRPELLPTAELRARFLAEAKALVGQGGPQVVRLLDAGVDEEQAWLALQPAPGQTLAARIAAGKPAPDGVVAYLAQSLADAVDAVHALGLTHGYLSGSDVIMAGELPRLRGFGLWGALDRDAALLAVGRGLHRIAPEVRAGRPATARSDLYSLAAMLVEVALGVAAESLVEAAALRDRLRRERPRLAEALLPALSAEPGERPASAALLAAGLAHLWPRAYTSPPQDATVKAVSPSAPGMALAVFDEPDDVAFDEPLDFETNRRSGSRPLVSFRTITPEPRKLPEPPPAFARDSGQVPSLDLPMQVPHDRPGTPLPLPAPVDEPEPAEAELLVVRAERLLTVEPPVRLSFAPPQPPLGPIAPTRRPTPTPVRAPSVPVTAQSWWIVGVATLLSVTMIAGAWWWTRGRDGGGADSGGSGARGGDDRGAPAALPTGGGRGPGARLPDPAPLPVAEVAPIQMGPCPDAMVLVEGRDLRVCIDTHEAPGAGRAPALGLTLEQAEAACAAAGKRLCTGEEWEAACRGERRASYPWGWSPIGGESCNIGTNRLAAAGAHPSCVSASGAVDMAGNAAEWVSDARVRGGSAFDGNDGRCSKKQPAPEAGTRADLGFRCCQEPK